MVTVISENFLTKAFALPGATLSVAALCQTLKIAGNRDDLQGCVSTGEPASSEVSLVAPMLLVDHPDLRGHQPGAAGRHGAPAAQGHPREPLTADGAPEHAAATAKHTSTTTSPLLALAGALNVFQVSAFGGGTYDAATAA